MKITGILNRFELASLKRMFNNAKAVAKFSNHSIIIVLFDMAKAIIFDGVGYMEYNLFHFIDKPKEIRETYVDFAHSQALFKLLNEREYMHIFSNKLEFNEKFKDFIGRDFIDAAHCTDAEFKKFLKGKKKIFAKPVDSCSGKGIYKSFDINSKTNANNLHKFMIDNNLFCEDTIIQNKQMNKLHDKAINTIRITTVRKANKAYVMYAILRIGIGDMSVDNVGSGGIYTVLSNDGEIINPCWSDKTITTYTVHPTNGYKLIGFKVPYFKDAVELVKKAALKSDHIKYIGWDIAISDKGPVIVEGNELPGYDMPQNYFVTNKDYGLLPDFEKILGKINV